MKETVYGQHLAYLPYNPSHQGATLFYNWTYQYELNQGNLDLNDRVTYCRDYFIDQSPDYANPTINQFIQPDYQKTGITLGVMFGSIIIGHLILYITARFIKGNNDVIAEYDQKIA